MNLLPTPGQFSARVQQHERMRRDREFLHEMFQRKFEKEAHEMSKTKITNPAASKLPKGSGNFSQRPEKPDQIRRVEIPKHAQMKREKSVKFRNPEASR